MTPREQYYNLRPRGLGQGEKVRPEWYSILGLRKPPPVDWIKHAPPPTPKQVEQMKEVARNSGVYFVDESQPFVTAYTDGSAKSTGGPCGFACILEFREHVSEFTGSIIYGTNQVAELSAIKLALESLTKPMQVRVFSDSQYAVNTCKDWMHKWKAQGWTRTKKPSLWENETYKVKNLDLIKHLYELNQKHRVEYNWVKGHAGNERNERCDVLANQARESVPTCL